MVRFLVLLPLYLVDVLSERLYGPVPGFTLVTFVGCIVWTFIGSTSWFYSCYIWWMCCLNFEGSSSWFFLDIFGGYVFWTFVGSSSWFYCFYIWWMCCLNVCRVQFVVFLPLYLVYVLSELVLGPVPGFILIIFGGYGSVPVLTPVLFGGCVFWILVGSSSWS